MTIRLGPGQAQNLRDGLARIDMLRAVLQAYMDADRRNADAIASDAGFNPEDFSGYRLKTEGGATFMVLVPKKAAGEVA